MLSKEKVSQIITKYFKGIIDKPSDGWDIVEMNSDLHRLIKQENGWTPVNQEYPKTGGYILLSFSNFSIPVVGRYEEDEEGGAFYIGDDDETCTQHDLIVNAWMNLPKPYSEEDE